MKVLFAVSSESISEAIIKKYQKEYKEILSYKNVYYFNAILKEIQKDKSYDRIVISEDLEPFSSNNYDAIDKFIFEKLDNISDEAEDIDGNETSIILICTDRHTKGSNFLVKLFGIGVYNALLGSDRSMENVCKLIKKPRLKKEAKINYKIDADDVNYSNKSEKEVSENEIQNILNHFKKLGKSTDKYADSFANIASQYTDDQLRIIINCLPIHVKAVLEGESSKYQEVMSVNGVMPKTVAESMKSREDKERTGISIDMLENRRTEMSGPIVIPSSVRNSKNRADKTVKRVDNNIQMPTGDGERKRVKKRLKRDDVNGPERPVRPNNEKIMTKRTAENPEARVKKVRPKSLEDVVSGISDNSENMEETKPKVKKVPSKVVQKEEKKGRGRPKKDPAPLPFKDNTKKIKKKMGIEEDEIELPSADDEDDIFLPGMETETPENMIEKINAEEEYNDVLPGFEEDDSLPLDDFDEEADDELPSDNFDEDVDDELPLDDFDEDADDELPLDDFDEEADDELPLDDFDEEADDELPSDDFDEDADNELPLDDFDDEYDDIPEDPDAIEEDDIDSIPLEDEEEFTDEVELPGLDELDEDSVLPEADDDDDDLLTSFDDFDEEDDMDNSPSNKTQENNQIESIRPRVDYSMSSLNSLMTKDKKIVTFIGTTKNGTSFLVNNLAALFSSCGINTAILDMTQNKNSYYVYTDNQEKLRSIAFNSISKLQKGFAEGIQVDKNLTVYTALPNDGNDYSDAESILSTLVQNHSLVLIDCDFETDPAYFASCQEIYLVQSMDVLTIQPLTAFLRNLKSKGVLESEKVRVVVNKEINVKSITTKAIIAAMSFYNDPSMSFMTDLFNKDMVKACSIPFEDSAYSKYLDSMVNCRISLRGYSKAFINKLKNLGDMVYPLVSKSTYSGKSEPQQNQKKRPFSNNMNSTLNQMKRKY